MLDRFLNSAAASMAAFGQVFMAETNRLRVLRAREAAAVVSEDPEVEDDEDDAEEGSESASGEVAVVLMEHEVTCPGCGNEHTTKFFIVRDGTRSVICKDADEAIAVREGWPHIQVDHTE